MCSLGALTCYGSERKRKYWKSDYANAHMCSFKCKQAEVKAETRACGFNKYCTLPGYKGEVRYVEGKPKERWCTVNPIKC